MASETGRWQRSQRQNGPQPSISRCCILSAREDGRTRRFSRRCGNRCCRCWNSGKSQYFLRTRKNAQNSRRKDTIARLILAGFTDAKGSETYNQGLSERRADAVKQLLSEKYEIEAGNLVTVGYGPKQLKDPANPFAAENRRVQVINAADK